MSRLFAAMMVDLRVQVRNNLYAIGIAAAAITAGAVAYLAKPSQLPGVVPSVVLLISGGTTLLYVSGMIIFEKDEGTLHAMSVSPLRPVEYLWSKVITLNILATLETLVMIGGAMALMRRGGSVALPNVPLFLLGVVAIGVFYTLLGIILVVRYEKITDFLIPMALVAGLLQTPFLYFLGVIKHPAFLIVPSTAPTMLIYGAFAPLSTWQWVYGLVYTAALLVGLSMWSSRAFHKHITMQIG